MTAGLYRYGATLIRVVDGDTVWLRVDLGFRTFVEQDFRLAGINSPEMHGTTHDAAVAARDYLVTLLARGISYVDTTKPDKFGRWLATIYLTDGTDVNAEMLSSGHAVVYVG